MEEFGFFRDLIVIFAVAVLVVVFLSRFGVPSIAGFILAGALSGPGALRLVRESHEVELLSELGVALLLFGIGLELQVDQVRRLWRPTLIGGALQVGLTLALGLALARGMGLAWNASILIGMVLALSSTAVVLRGLTARGELEAPHGQVALGILIFQDLSVVPMMLLLPLLIGGAEGSPWGTLGRSVLLLSVLMGAAWWIVPRVLEVVARSRERDLFVLTVMLVSLGTAFLATGAGVSLALGAFFAGLIVSGSAYRHQALSEVIPFREVFTSLFFVSVGMLLTPATLVGNLPAVLGWLAAIILGKTLVVVIAASLLGLSPIVAVRAGLALAQVGEFAFVVLRAANGGLPPTVEEPLLSAIILSMLVTPLLLAAAPRLAARAWRWQLLPWLQGVRVVEEADVVTQALTGHVVIAGYGLAGRGLARALKDCGTPYVILDLNPDNVRQAVAAGEPAYYGDITARHVLAHLGVARAREIVLVVNDPTVAQRALAAIRAEAPEIFVLVRARYAVDVTPLLASGANEVIPAEVEAAVEVAARVLERHGADAATIAREIARIRAEVEEGR